MERFILNNTMLSFKESNMFFKSGDFIFAKDEISSIDCSKIEELEVIVTLKSGQKITANDIHALELIMQTRPSMLEGKRLSWPKFVWMFHNIVAHPLTQIFALLKMYKVAFWIHDSTIPKPLGKKKKKIEG